MVRVPGRLFVSVAAVLSAIGLSCPQSGGGQPTVAPQTPTELAVVPPADDLFDSPVAAEEVEDVQEPELDEATGVRVADSETVLEDPDPEGAEEVEETQPIVAVPEQEEVFELAALRKETWVFAEPRWGARKIGYLRSGSVVQRKEKPAGYQHCKKGWYRIEPKGFVCVGKAATLETHHPIVEAAGRAPDRSQGLPYAYAMSEFPTPPFYVRLPSEADQRSVEQDLAKHLKQKRDLSAFESYVGPVPGSLLYERSLPSANGDPRGPDTLYTGRPVPRSGFGLLHVFSWTDRLFGVTTDLALIPLDRTKPVVASTMQGIHLVEDQGLPIAFVRSKASRLYRIDLETRAVEDAGEIPYRQGFPLTGRRVRVGGNVYLEARDGTFLREDPRVVVIPTMKNVPGWATKGRKWIDVSILRQTLVAYEGMRPVFATMVSTGVDGLGDPKETHSTVLGAFVIHTKHVTATMDSDAEGDVYDLRDVPYVQYFTEGYALHAAYWHDSFGTPRSHGCINLSPIDASWLFAWTDPEVPKGWHARLQLHGGTLVHTHP